jgi:hypothetical protein
MMEIHGDVQRGRHLKPYRQARQLYLDMHTRSGRNPGVDSRRNPGDNRTIEHVVPRHLFRNRRPEMDGDMHNFQVYPARLNSVRGIRRHGSASDVTFLEKRSKSLVAALSRETGLPLLARNSREFRSSCLAQGAIFVPEISARGRIARCAGYVMLTYPDLAADVHERVLDIDRLILWHHLHPISSREARMNAMISDVQGIQNDLIADPSSIRGLGESFGCQMDLFDAFDYAGHFDSARKSTTGFRHSERQSWRSGPKPPGTP